MRPDKCVHCFVMVELQRRQTEAAKTSEPWIGEHGLDQSVGALIECLVDIDASTTDAASRLVLREYIGVKLDGWLEAADRGEWKSGQVEAHHAGQSIQ